MTLFFLLFAIILLYFYIENKINLRCLASFKAVIHVNGIRGKTSTCRYIDAALRSRYKVFTKTTGTDAMMITAEGKECPVRRLGPANIHEQLRIIRRAHREGAEILILECMAVNPELQKIAQAQIVRSNITVITNVRYDHIFEMGDTLEEIAGSLSATIPENGTLYTADENGAALFAEKCREKNCKLVLCPPTGTVTENIGIARAVSASLGVTEEEFKKSLPEVRDDFGVRRLYELPVESSAPPQPCLSAPASEAASVFHFLNLFSANDPQSTRSNVEEVRGNHSGLYFLYNHRGDRPDRAFLFARYFFPHYRDCTVFVTGKGAALPKRLFKSAGISDIRIALNYKFCLNDIPPGSLLVGIGNIKGAGYELVKSLEEQTLSQCEVRL